MTFKSILAALLIALLLSFIFFKTKEIFVKDNLTSPVLGVSKQKVSVNVWSPVFKPESFNIDPEAPEITALSALFVETNSGEILYAKNPRQELSIASLVKIMTVIIALENRSLNDLFTVSQRAADMEPDKMLLIPGERLTLKELLDGIFLVSANDASEVIAENTTGRREEFINLMNSKARQLGMNNTLFLNPSGLEEDFAKQYSTALDVAIMSRYLVKTFPEVVDISSQTYVFIEATSDHQDYEMYSGINLLSTYPGVLGLKTGFTPEAGLTLVTLARRGNEQVPSSGSKEIIGVLLGAVNRRDDAKLLLDYSFKKLGLQI